MFDRRRRRREKKIEQGIIDDMVDNTGRSPGRDRAERVVKRKERKEKRREFFMGLTSNIKWIMLAAAVIALILFAKFGLPSFLTTGI